MVEIEWYALRIVIERRLVNFARHDLESAELNFSLGGSIPRQTIHWK